ncbi:MAG: TIGR00282 family metallophosphoesterase [Deltaproteobacteria bacterium]|nr:MAG: TIGR00282 family metallophosphoesterase [Deltaproteobacteria bacterium]
MPAEHAVRILLLGDIVGKPGRRAVATLLPELKRKLELHLVIANSENASGGLGLTPEQAQELLDVGIDVLTSGNHIWKHKNIRPFLDKEPRLLRPANYPAGAPGHGSGIFEALDGTPVGVLNLEGQIFMNPLPSPFAEADRHVQRLRQRCKVVIVDFHAEATSEKRALGLYLDGRVTAVIGTHTHVPTADAQVLDGGTGYLTDVGMCGPVNSVIGMRKEQVIYRLTTHLPATFQVAAGPSNVQGALVVADPGTGKCLEISRHTWQAD